MGMRACRESGRPGAGGDAAFAEVRPATGDGTRPAVLHAVVGHGLATYFLNAVRSVLAQAPDDPVLVVDNASPGASLPAALASLAADHAGRLELVRREENDVAGNAKVGSLYEAYRVVFDRASRRGVDYVHLLQGDMQLLWWDDDVVRRAEALFEAHPRCVNIHTQALSRDRRLSGELEESATTGVLRLTGYGLTDTGLYRLSSWQEHAIEFAGREHGHGRRYLEAGYEVLCHPWPTVAPIPWPAVVRNGAEQGIQVDPGKPFLLRGPTRDEVRSLKASVGPRWLEDLCTPWGWTCLTPMWVTDADAVAYWVLRWREARKSGLARAIPRLALGGVDPTPRGVLRALRWHQPSLLRLGRGFVRAATTQVAGALAGRLCRCTARSPRGGTPDAHRTRVAAAPCRRPATSPAARPAAPAAVAERARATR